MLNFKKIIVKIPKIENKKKFFKSFSFWTLNIFFSFKKIY